VTPLERALRERIAAGGPITVEAFMDACSSYYYATRDPLGTAGDFTTAPEISQMFGEMVGAALAECWTRAGSPEDAVYVELGPGRGTLAADALRVLRGAGFAGPVQFVETSPVLREIQGQSDPAATWHDSVEGLPRGGPLLLVANEFFDALPVRQFIGGIERKVAVTPAGLAFDRDGEVIEDSPVRDQAARQIGALLNERGGVAIVIDYGHAASSPGETLQAVRGHSFAPLLHKPGEQDLTAHVDFEALASAAVVGEIKVTPLLPQGEWLKRLGIGVRAAALADASPDRAAELATAVQRLTGKAEMGELFKVLAIRSGDWPAPAGLE
jgi:NADH dehydrogenase [ubiquinone] 1 alpha subcomplex assembly factor 7